MILLLSQLYYNIGIFVILWGFNPLSLPPKSSGLDVDLKRSATPTFWTLPR